MINSISLEFFYHCYHWFKKILCSAEICFGLSSKNMNLVVSISNILVAAFCFDNFFCGVGSPIHGNVSLFFEISQLAWDVGSSAYIPSDFTIYVGTEKSYSILISFRSCTALPFDRSFYIPAIVLICKRMIYLSVVFIRRMRDEFILLKIIVIHSSQVLRFPGQKDIQMLVH